MLGTREIWLIYWLLLELSLVPWQLEFDYQPSSQQDSLHASTGCFVYSIDTLRKLQGNYSCLLSKYNSSSRMHCPSYSCLKLLVTDFFFLPSQALVNSRWPSISFYPDQREGIFLDGPAEGLWFVLSLLTSFLY